MFPPFFEKIFTTECTEKKVNYQTTKSKKKIFCLFGFAF